MADDQSTLIKAVVRVLHDSAKGFPDVGEHLKDTSKKSFFVQEGQTRAEFAQQLESAYSSTTGETLDVGGTGVGAVHRVWGDLKASLGGGDHTLLETAEQGEDAAKKAYKEALESSSVTGEVRALLQQQQPHIQASHDKVKAMRDSTAS